MSKHALSPWHWAVHNLHGDDDHVLPSLIDKEGNEVLWLGDSALYDMRCGYAPEHADAHLIAAAPDLLEALNSFIELGIDEKSLGKWPELLDALDKARAAIARARGEK